MRLKFGILCFIFLFVLNASAQNLTINEEFKFKNTDKICEQLIPVKLNLGNFNQYKNPFSLSEPERKNILNPFYTDDIEKENNINTTKLIIASTGLTGLFIGFHFYQMNAWWKDQRGPFHVQDDPDYACKIDKIGHFYGGLISARLGIALSEWVGFNKRTSAWIGAGIGSLWELFIEFEDGFGQQWGFSPSDATADVLGAFYPLAQEYWEPLKAFNFKFSYIPSEQYKSGKKKIYFDDYEGHTYWLTANIYELLPADMKKDYPDYLRWLQIGFGYGLRNWNGDFEFSGISVTDKELYIALDYDLEKLLEIDTKFFRGLKESEIARSIAWVLNHFHWPAPAIRITFPGEYWADSNATNTRDYPWGKRDPKPSVSVILLGFYFSN